MNCSILVNAYSESEEYLYQAKRLQAELSCLGVKTDVVKNYCGVVQVPNDNRSDLLKKSDFVVYLDKDKYLALQLESMGIRLFNPSSAIFTCDDKMLTHLALSEKGIPMPKTIAAPLCYLSGIEIGDEEVEKVANELGMPVVIKQSYGSLGKQVHLAKDKEELKSYMQDLICEPHFYQEYIKDSFGKDVRVIAIGGKAVTAMERNSGGNDFRSNMSLGGQGKRVEITPEMEELVQKITTALGLDYCGIDLLYTKSGFTVCEVNSNAFFKGSEKTTGVNIAKLYAEYIVETMKKDCL